MNIFDFFLPYIFFISTFDQVYYPQLFLTIDTLYPWFWKTKKDCLLYFIQNNIRKLLSNLWAHCFLKLSFQQRFCILQIEQFIWHIFPQRSKPFLSQFKKIRYALFEFAFIWHVTSQMYKKYYHKGGNFVAINTIKYIELVTYN